MSGKRRMPSSASNALAQQQQQNKKTIVNLEFDASNEDTSSIRQLAKELEAVYAMLGDANRTADTIKLMEYTTTTATRTCWWITWAGWASKCRR